jgi:hypothetical protein
MLKGHISFTRPCSLSPELRTADEMDVALGHFGGYARRLPSGLVVPVAQGRELCVYGQKQVHHFRPWADVLPGIHALVSLCRRE